MQQIDVMEFFSETDVI